MMATKNPRSHDDYTVGWIYTLPLEIAAVKLMLDALHPTLAVPSTDQNNYILGNVGGHNTGFSLIEAKQHEGSYMMHPVVQNWCLHIAGIDDVKARRLNELALVYVGHIIPSISEQNYWELQQRLLAHADYVHQRWSNDQLTGDIAIWGAFHGLGNLYSDQGKLKEAETMYQ